MTHPYAYDVSIIGEEAQELEAFAQALSIHPNDLLEDIIYQGLQAYRLYFAHLPTEPQGSLH